MYMHSWLNKIVSDNKPHCLQKGFCAEEIIADAANRAGMKYYQAKAGSIADVEDKVDMVILYEGTLFFIQVKMGNGLNESYPKPRKEVIDEIDKLGLKHHECVIHVFGSMDGDVDPAELCNAINSTEAVVFAS